MRNDGQLSGSQSRLQGIAKDGLPVGTILNGEQSVKNIILSASVIAGVLFAGYGHCASGQQEFDRTVLPIHPPKVALYTELNARNATPPARFEVKAPEGAPNVLLILIDDMGFGVSSAFGGPAHMPTLEGLAGSGVRYNRFHTTSLCAPTRAALLSGRNHHMNNMGSITEMATAFPGSTGVIPLNVSPISNILRLNGYSTAQFGKNHETAAWEVSPSGSTDRWPTRKGFDKFYGFFGGETNQWAPLIYDGMTPVEVPDDPNYNFMTDMTNKAIEWVNFQQALTPDKPFFLYFAPGATHAPHHVPEDWIAKYKGKFDQGWDEVREETLARQIALGVVPAGTQLAPKPPGIKDWDTLSADEKRLLARQMEVFAAFAEYADTEIGRVIESLREMGELDNTLIFYIAGDNGTSAEGGMSGVANEYTSINGVPESVEGMLEHYEDWGGPMTYPHMAIGWAIASDTPFSWAKQVAGDFGGTRNGMVVHWPDKFKGTGEVRSQFAHVIDIAPTILEATNIPEPKMVNGIKQVPIQGKTLIETFTDANASTGHTTQYFEMFGNRAIYHEGWLARVLHRAPWEREPSATLEEDTWQLYNTDNDFSLVNDLAAQEPKRLKKLQALFMKEASVNHALPLDDRSFERMNAEIAGRPDLMAGRTSLTLRGGMRDMGENAFINIKNKSHAITAEIEVPSGGGNGVILAQGGRFGGWTLYVKDGKPSYTYNYLDLERTTIAASKALPAGKASVRFEFSYDGGGLGKGGTGTLFVNGEQVNTGRIERTQPLVFSMDETADVGVDGATPVVENYGSADGQFTGRVNKVTIDLEETLPGKEAKF